MNKTNTLGVRFTNDERIYLEQLSQSKGFTKLSSFIRTLLLENYENKIESTIDYRKARCSRRVFSCDEDLWLEMRKKTKTTVSEFLRDAIKQKLKRME